MDFTFTEEQDAIADLAASIFAGEVTVDRIKAAETGDDGFDRDLWATLAKAQLLGIALAPDLGGTGGRTVELCRMLEQAGRYLAPVPLAETLVAAATLDAHGTAAQRRRWVVPVIEGNAVLTVAVDPSASAPTVTAARRGDGWRLDGWLPCVPAAAAATTVVLPASVEGRDEWALFVVDRAAEGVAVEPVTTTDRQPAGHITVDGTTAEQLGDGSPAAVAFLAERLLLARSAVALGVAAEALRRAAEYTSQRHQFGRPLSSFQSTAHRAADSYIDVAAMRATLWQAAWLLDQYDDPEHDPTEASAAVLTAAWWAADGGERVVQAVQHLHGGLGADIDYPVHRYFLWGKQLALTLGGASANLAHLGGLIARRALATQEVNA